MSSGNGHIYIPLPSPRHIRLLVLKPSFLASTVSCELVCISLDDDPTFEALSYVWGPPEPTKSIKCCGERVTVRLNLDTALRNLRYSFRERVLWVDALCINQDDLIERNAQVRLMGAIYAQASTTLVWLGEDDGTCSEALGFVQHFQDSHRNPELTQHLLQVGKTPETRELLGTLRFDAESVLALKRLYERPWFSRKWIVQELVLSRNPIIIIGHRQLPWFMLENLSTILVLWSQHFVMFDKSDLPARQGMIAAATLGGFRGQKPGLLQLVMTTLDFKCSDPHDHLISLLGIAAGTPEADVVSLADYTIQPDVQFRRFMMLGVQRIEGLTLLALVNLIPLQSRVPSWVADLSALDSYAVASMTMTDDNIVTATRSSDVWADLSEDGRFLTLMGCCVDSVATLAHQPSAIYSQVSPGMGRKEFEWFTEVADMAVGLPFDDLDSSLFRGGAPEAFLRAFLMDAQSRRPVEELQDFLHHTRWRVSAFERLAELQSTAPENNQAVQAELSTIMEELTQRKVPERARLNRYFCRTRAGRYGWMPLYAQPGDIICIFTGSKAAHLLRPSSQGNFKLVGDCYVQGLMCGEIEYMQGMEPVPIVLE